MGKRKNQDRKPKINLVFDENKRREFLCGFRKRKLERKKKAQEELKRLLKDEKKRIKQENKETYKRLVLSSRPIPDIEQLLQEEYEDDDVNVKIVELSSDTLKTKNLCIGDNKPIEQLDKEKIHTSKRNQAFIHKAVPGMDLEETNELDDPNPKQSGNNIVSDSAPKTKHEIKKMLKTQATKKIQKSKLFRMKNKLERVRNKKKSQQKSKLREKKMLHMEKGKKRRNTKKH